MKARLKLLRTELLLKLAPEFSKFNFQLNAAKAEYRIQKVWGSAAIMLSFIEHGETDFDVTGSVGLRIDAVEDLVNANNPMATQKEKLTTFTIGGELGNLSVGKQKRWSVKNERDVAPVASDFAGAVESIGVPYLQKYSDFEVTLDALSGNERANWLHSPVHGARAERALALAYVLKDHEKVDALIQQNRAFLKARNDFGLAAFEALIEKIKT